MANNVVLLAITLDELDKFLGVWLARLTLANTLDTLQFLKRYRIVGSHLLNRHILEDDIGRTLHPLGHLLAEISEHGCKCGVESTGGYGILGIVVVLTELVVEHYLERKGLLDVFLARRGHFQQTIVLNILLEIASNKSLTD